VLVYGLDPLRIYLFKEGLTRLATEAYEKPTKKNMKNLFQHLTNYAINKNNDNFQFNDDEDNDDVGHKRSFTGVLKQLKSEGVDIDLLMNRVVDMIIKTIIMVQPNLAHLY